MDWRIKAASQIVWPCCRRRRRCCGCRWCRYGLRALLLLLLLLLLLHCCSGGEAWPVRWAGLLLHLVCCLGIVLLLWSVWNRESRRAGIVHQIG